jgi:hypothetical protein
MTRVGIMSILQICRQELAKAPVGVLRCSSAFIYIICLGAFAALLQHQAGLTITETTVSKKHLGGDYTCEMLAKYNGRRTLATLKDCKAGGGDAKLEAVFTDVMASYDQCMTALATLDTSAPAAYTCSANYQPGPGQPISLNCAGFMSYWLSGTPSCVGTSPPCFTAGSFTYGSAPSDLAAAGGAGTVTLAMDPGIGISQIGVCSLWSNPRTDVFASIAKSFDKKAICDLFNDMPPYVCTRLVRPGIFTIVSSGPPNAHASTHTPRALIT